MDESAGTVFGGDPHRMLGEFGWRGDRDDDVARLQLFDVSVQDTLFHVTEEERPHPLKQRDSIVPTKRLDSIEPSAR